MHTIDNKIYISPNDILEAIGNFCFYDYDYYKDEEYLSNTDIIAISRGGLIPAQTIAYKLGIKRIHSLGISFYNKGKETKSEYSDTPEFYQEITSPLAKNILLIDDINDSGMTFKFAVNYLANKFKIDPTSESFKTFAIFQKHHTNWNVDYYSKLIENSKWVVFPWDKEWKWEW